MKTKITKLIAAIFTMATVTATTNSALAQRRPTQNANTETRVEKGEESRKNAVREKNASQIKENQNRNSKSSTVTNRRESNNPAKVNSRQTDNLKTQKPDVTRQKTTTRQTPAASAVENSRYNNSARRSTGVNAVPAENRARREHNQTVYRLDSKDNRYTVNNNFKGRNSYWSVSYATERVPYSKRDNNFYKNYDHRKYRHWDRTWETYRWNVSSWRDYYSSYHPHSYRFHKHYFHHPRYGHVIRKFQYRPVFFVHNNIRYYNYNGHFFKYFRGVGYVLIDMPYGIVFSGLPSEYERVYINGYPYFRVGNLFFERNPYGYALVHYPERYFAYEAGFFNGGYYHAGDFYIRF